MSKSFGQSFRVDEGCGLLAVKLFSSWDFKVVKTSSVELMSQNISTQLKVRRTHTLTTHNMHTHNTQHTHNTRTHTRTHAHTHARTHAHTHAHKNTQNEEMSSFALPSDI